VDAPRLASADSEPGQWLTPGRDAGGTYFSPLSDIDEHNADRLGFAWQYDLKTSRGLEASPVVVDGVMFAVGNFGRVYALDARTGAERWVFVPNVDMQWARYACCDVVNRGIAVWKGRVYVAALDGYLYCLDANTGKPLWKVDTLIGRTEHRPYTSTGAPAITRDAVVIGNAGGDYSGVRGYISAYDLDNGAVKWRFFTVPRDPALGAQDQPHLIDAVKTWDPRHRWDVGGGGTVWDGLSYDAKTDLVFMGTGNVSPYNTREGGRKGGKELYACSVIAVHASDGSLAWYYQEVPDDRWDFDSDQKFILTTLTIGDRKHNVLLHAPKNGYFYVFERATGELLAANNFTFVNWTKGLDPQTHQPVPDHSADYHREPALVWPSAFGAHSWQPMSFSPNTGLVYIPAIEMPNVMVELSDRPAKAVDGWFTVQGIMAGDYDPKESVSLYGKLPSLETLRRRSPLGSVTPQGTLIAWDPVAERAVWKVASASIWDGGVMSTAGNLVFRGDARGFLNVYAADSGRLVKSIDLGTSILAAPVTYKVQADQYVAVMAGYGGGGGFAFAPETAAYKYGNAGRIIALKLGGASVPKPEPVVDTPFQKPTVGRSSPAQAAQGEILYNRVCSRCHVFGRGMLPDLRRFSPPDEELFYDIVLKGADLPKGMGRFDDVLNRSDVSAIRAYLIDQAWNAYEGKAPPAMKSY
jgi:quinohemoprotein ethanol dehydrogenase